MTTRRNTKNLFATSTAAVLFVGLLAGCSGGGSVEDFCEDSKALSEGTFAQDIDPTDPEGMKSAFSDVVSQVKDIDAPSEIKDDWEVLVSTFESLNDGIQEADVSDPATLNGVLEKFTTPEVQTASENVATFTEERCDA